MRVLGVVLLAVAWRLFSSGVFGGSEVLELETGECFNSAQLATGGPETEVTDLEVVPCDQSHYAEVVGVFEYDSASDDAFPGVEALNQFAIGECALAVEDYIATDLLTSGFDLIFVVPNSDGWRAGDKTAQCAVARLDGLSSTGSVRGGGPVVPDDLISVFQVNEGDCLDLSPWYAFGLPRTCAEPHDLEVFAVLTIPAEPGAPYSSVDQIVSIANGSCLREYGSRVDPSANVDLGYGPIAFPVPGTWELGHRTYVCGLFAADSSKLVGSRLLAHSRHEDLIRAEFGDASLLIDFEGFSDLGTLNLVGSAHREGGALAITEFAEHANRGVPFEEERPQRGAAWFSEPIPVEQGFVTAFVFQFEMYSWFTVGDGMAFVIQAGDPNALGVGIGYDGIPNSIAVEFDTLKEDWLSDPRNNVPDAPDLLGNHVAVHTQGTSSNNTHTDAALGWANLEGFYMADRSAHVALIAYEPGELSVFVDDFETPALTVEIDIAETLRLDPDGKAYVGFTASSGPETSRGPRTLTITGHKVFAWELSTPG